MNIDDWQLLRDLVFVFGIVLLIGGIYIAGTASSSDLGWTSSRALALAYNGWDIVLLLLGSCLISSAIVFHFRVKAEEQQA